MNISVCYITCGVHDIQSRTLDVLGQYTPSDCQIIILQNGCTIPVIFYNATIIETSTITSISRARNLCLKHVTGDIVIWIDDDIECCEGYTDSFAAPFNDDMVGITGYEALIIREDFECQWYIDPQENHGRLEYFDSPYAISMGMIKNIGGYDENIGPLVCDNTDLCLRAIKAGYKLVYVDNPGIKHWRGRTANRLLYTGYYRDDNKPTHDYMRQKYTPGWKDRYGLSYPYLINPQLEFPEPKGRYGGPEDTQDCPLDDFL